MNPITFSNNVRLRKKYLFGLMISSQKKQSVLLVDDDGVTNFINYRLIKNSQLSENIFTAYNGLEGIDFVKTYASKNLNKCPELIILDINMPHLDGFEFLDLFYRIDFANIDSVRIVVLTTSTNERDLSKLSRFQDKSVGYINKPLTLKKLEEVLA